MVALVDVEVIKLLVALNPFPGDGDPRVGRVHPLFTYGVEDGWPGTPSTSRSATGLGRVRSHLTCGASGGKPMANGTSRRPSRPQRGRSQANPTNPILAARVLHRRVSGPVVVVDVVGLLPAFRAVAAPPATVM